ncbi:Endonuclease/exonuclease/phosphatase,Zinc finger, CCHC-type, partial [Cinara cedri]
LCLKDRLNHSSKSSSNKPNVGPAVRLADKATNDPLQYPDNGTNDAILSVVRNNSNNNSSNNTNPIQSVSSINAASHLNTNIQTDKYSAGKKSFAETTINSALPKNDQAIVFESIDNIPQIEYIIAISKLTSPKNIKFVSRISNGRFCIFFNDKNTVDFLIDNHLSIKLNDHTIIKTRRLINPAKRIIISNVSPAIPNDSIILHLKDHNIQIVSPITHINAGFNIPELAHILSFRRQVYINPDDFQKLPNSAIIMHENTPHRIFFSDDTLSCYTCKLKGHTSKQCKNLLTEASKTKINESQGYTNYISNSKVTDDNTVYNKPICNSFSEPMVYSNSNSTSPTTDQPALLDDPVPTEITYEETIFPIPNTTNQIKIPVLSSTSTSLTSDSCFLKSPSQENLDTHLEPISHIFEQHNQARLNFAQFKHIIETIATLEHPLDIIQEYEIEGNYKLELLEKFRPFLLTSKAKNNITRITTNYPSHIKNFQGFNKYRTTSDRVSGGVSIFIKSNIPSKDIQININLETIAISVELSVTFTLCNIYLPNQTDFSLLDLENIIRQLPKPFILVGDFNSHNIIWGSNNTNPRGKIIEKLIQNEDLVLLIDSTPTHINLGNGNLSNIDLSLKIWNLKNPNWNLYTDLLEEEIKKILDHNIIDIEETTQTFINLITDIAKKSIGTTKQTKKPRVPWWNNNIKEAISDKNKALIKFKKNKTPENFIELKRLRAKSRFLIKNSKKESWNEFTSIINVKTNPSEVWRKIKSLKGLTRNNDIFIKTNQNTITDQTEVADILGNFFHENSSDKTYNKKFINEIKILKENNQTKSTIDPNNLDQINLNLKISMEELEQTLKDCKSKSPGPDKIPYSFLLNSGISTKQHLLNIYNHIWKKGQIPIG